MARTEIDRADARFGWMMAAPALATLFLVILFPCALGALHLGP